MLVGGGSSRMGHDKALLKYGGGTLVQAVAEAVRQATGNVALVGSVQLYGHLGYGVLPDIYPGEGPLGGILSVLQNSAAEWTLIVACDMPGLTADFLHGLMEAAERSDGDVLVPVGPGGRLEPLCAVYHRRSRQGIYKAFEQGVRKVATALEKVRAVTLAVPEVLPFQNVNTPEEWRRYAR